MSPPPEDIVQVEPSPAEKVLPPCFVENLQSTQVFDGHEIRLTCKVEGKPVPKISWFHNGINIDNNDEYVITYNPETGCVCLHIVEALPEDQGEYICKATNLAGQATTSATLTVYVPQEEIVTPVKREGEKAKPAAIPPTFVETLQPQTVQDGSQVILTCKINAYPKPKITWYKDEIQIEPSNDFHITFEIESGRCTLIITEVYPEDAGDYSCHAVNIYGESVTTTTITVKSKYFSVFPYNISYFLKIYKFIIRNDQFTFLPNSCMFSPMASLILFIHRPYCHLPILPLFSFLLCIC